MDKDATYAIINEYCHRIDEHITPESIDVSLGFFINVKSRKGDGSLKSDSELEDEIKQLYIDRMASDFNIHYGIYREYDPSKSPDTAICDGEPLIEEGRS